MNRTVEQWDNHIEWLKKEIDYSQKNIDLLKKELREAVEEREAAKNDHVLKTSPEDSFGYRFARMKANHEDLKTRNNTKHVVWSVIQISDPINTVAIVGEVVVSTNFYGGYEETLTNPTWEDLFVLADKGIVKNDDYHHIYLEGVYKNAVDGVWTLSMGS